MKKKIFIFTILFFTNVLLSQSDVFTLEDLKDYNGKNGKPSYVAVDGVVYDVSKVKSWKNGKHFKHNAGQDLTDEFKKAPAHIHNKNLLNKLPKVGILRKDIKTYKVKPDEYGKSVICPVMKEKFKISKNTKALIYKNRVYYFCCPECYEDFKKTPEKYLGGSK